MRKVRGRRIQALHQPGSLAAVPGAGRRAWSLAWRQVARALARRNVSVAGHSGLPAQPAAQLEGTSERRHGACSNPSCRHCTWPPKSPTTAIPPPTSARPADRSLRTATPLRSCSGPEESSCLRHTRLLHSPLYLQAQDQGGVSGVVVGHTARCRNWPRIPGRRHSQAEWSWWQGQALALCSRCRNIGSAASVPLPKLGICPAGQAAKGGGQRRGGTATRCHGLFAARLGQHSSLLARYDDQQQQAAQGKRQEAAALSCPTHVSTACFGRPYPPDILCSRIRAPRAAQEAGGSPSSQWRGRTETRRTMSLEGKYRQGSQSHQSDLRSEWLASAMGRCSCGDIPAVRAGAAKRS